MGNEPTYFDSSIGVLITKQRAIKELLNHGCTELDLFFRDNGDQEFYLAHNVLNWLGY